MAQPATPPATVAALLLTGGASRRMGEAKAALMVDGLRLADRTAALLAGVAGPVVEVGPGYTSLPTAREEPPGAGPLAALAAGAAALGVAGAGRGALVVATDLPNLTAGLLRLLADHPSDGCVVPLDAGGRAQAACARYSPSALALAPTLVAAGRRSLMALLDQVPVTWLAPSEWLAAAGRTDVLADLDTPEDLAALATPGRRPPVRKDAPQGVGLDPPIRRPVTAVRVIAVRPDHHLEIPDQVVTEEPMEIRAAGPGQRPQPVAVTMRTPGHDFELAAGFLGTEGLIAGRADVAAVKYCVRPDDATQRFNTVTVELTTPLADDRIGRPFSVNASCGICGKASIDQVTVSCAVLPPAPAFPRSLLLELPERLRAGQHLFSRTGGLHAAAVFRPDGTLLCLREDVGRHNAVDKVAGQALLAGQWPLTGHVLMVSGRVSFEIVQKAAMAGLAVIAAVSAPSSLAIEAAQRLGVTIAGFVRGERFNLYSHPERIDLGR